MAIVRIAALGAPGVGKTALVEQFVCGQSCSASPNLAYERSVARRRLLCCTAVLGDRIYELHCLDLPPISTFPRDSLEEWDLCCGQGIRLANAYILVFDLSRPHTFQQVSTIYERLVECRPAAAVVVAATKQDLVSDANGRSLVSASTAMLLEGVAGTIRKQWKRPFVECSAAHNWRVTEVFQALQALMQAVESNCQLDDVGDGHQRQPLRSGVLTEGLRPTAPVVKSPSKCCRIS